MVQIYYICTTEPTNSIMATITAFIRVATAKKKKAKVRFRLRDGRKVQLLYASDIEVKPEYWDAKHETIKAKVVMNPTEKAQVNKGVAQLKSIIADIYEAAADKEALTSAWLKTEIDKALHPEKYGIKKDAPTFFEYFERFIDERDVSEVRKRGFRVLYRDLQRYELYSQLNTRADFKLDLATFTADTLRSFEEFLTTEHTHFTRDEETGKVVCDRKYKPVMDALPETRTPAPRGQNTINTIFNELRTFFNWAVLEGLIKTNPFRKFTIKEAVYGTPYYITIEERNQLYRLDLSDNPKLAIQRDIFVFQCLIGCRVGDLYKMTRANVINGAIEYIPRKTKEGRPITVRVPLNDNAKEILERYSDYKGESLLPFISEQKYNIAIKKAFRAAGLTRPVTVLNPTTREPEIKPINEVASSHLARRCFVGNLYKQVKDPNLVGALSGHSEGSRAFARYREIDEQMKKDLVNLLG